MKEWRKIFALFAPILIIFIAEIHAVDFKILRVDNCTTSNKTMIIEKCEGIENKITIIFDMFRPISKLNVQLNLFKIERTDLKPIFKSRPIEWCSIIEGRTKANPIVKTFISASLNRFPAAVRKCPMSGRVEVINLVLNTKILAILPIATYKIQARSYDSVDREIFWFSMLFQIQD